MATHELERMREQLIQKNELLEWIPYIEKEIVLFCVDLIELLFDN